MDFNRFDDQEWPTLVLMTGCYGVWFLATGWISAWSLPAGMLVTALAVTLHSSLQHEFLHGHPFRSASFNEALIAWPLGLVYPYRRFRDLHLAHHRDENLTDPYDDPESNYFDPNVWAGLPAPVRALLMFNNTLLGRLIVGPAIGTAFFLAGDLRAIRAGNPRVLRAWALHVLAMVPVIGWIWCAAMPGWAYVSSAYAGLSILKIRTFLEHRAHELARGRTVVVEQQGLLSFLFLNNSFHVVHHAKPNVAWHRLPALYRERREDYLRRNDGYIYGSYGEIFRRYLFQAKDPVPHPLRPGGTVAEPAAAAEPADGSVAV